MAFIGNSQEKLTTQIFSAENGSGVGNQELS
jgi:hypothetical protein